MTSENVFFFYSFYSVAVMGSRAKEKQNLHREVTNNSELFSYQYENREQKPKFCVFVRQRLGRSVVVRHTSDTVAV